MYKEPEDNILNKKKGDILFVLKYVFYLAFYLIFCVNSAGPNMTSVYQRLSLQEVQPSSAGRQGDKAEGYHGSMGPPWRHGHHSGQQSDAEGVELHHRQPRPRPHGM